MANSAIVGTLRAVLSADVAEFASATKKAGDAAEAMAADMTKAATSFEAAGARMSAVTRLVKDFSGSLERRSAEEFALAIEKIGGAAKLSENELRRAQGVFADYLSKAKAMGQEVPAHIQKVSDEIGRLSVTSGKSVSVIGDIKSAFSNLGPSMLAAAGGFATALISVEALTRGLRAAIDFVKDSIDAYAQAERAQRKLTAALEQQGQAVPETIAAYKQLADQFQKTTVFQDDLITEMQTLLVQVGNVMPHEMEKALQAVTNLASGLGIDLRSATMMVAKAAEDNFTALGRQGVQIDKTRAAAEGFDYILGQINAKFGGQAAADLRTFDGQLKATANQFDELKETIGKTIVQSTAFQLAFIALRAELAKIDNDIRMIVLTMKGLASMPGPVGTAFKAIVGDLKGASTGAKQVSEALIEWQGPIQDTTQALPKLTTRIKENTREVNALEKAYRDWADEATGAAALRALGELESRFHRLRREGGLNALALEALAKEAHAFRQKGHVLSDDLHEISKHLITLRQGVVSTTVSLPAFSDALSVSADELKALGAQFQDVNKKFDDLNKLINTSKGVDGLFKGGVSAKDLEEARAQIKSFSQQSADAMFTLADVFHEVGRTIGGEAGRIVASVGEIAEGIGMLASGDTLAGVTSLVGVVINLGRQFRTVGRNIARDMQDAFATTELGFDHLNALMQHLRELGATDLVSAGDRAQRRDDEEATRRWMEDVRKFLDEVDRRAALAFDGLTKAAEEFGGKAPQALQPFIQELLRANTLTGEQRALLEGLAGAPEWEQLQSIAQKYGIELSALGQSFQDARIGDIALQYARDFMTLRDAGGDVNGLLIGMQDEIQALVLDSLKFGTALPEALRDVIGGLIDMGLLVDASGNKFEDLASSGLTFTGTIEDAFKDMQSILEEIRDLLAGGLPDAVRRGGREIEDEVSGWSDRIRRRFDDIRVTIPVDFDIGSFTPPSGFSGGGEIPSLDTGGRITRDGLIYAHAGEAIVPLDRGLTDQPIVINTYLDGRLVAQNQMQYLKSTARRMSVRPV